MQSFGAILKFDPHFFSIIRNNSNHLGGVENAYDMYWHVVI